eukprot:COSAG02_NODE_1859_length_10614_cov_53.814075_7_plen_152_part_00
MPAAVDISAAESEAESPDPTPGVLRNWDEVPVEQPDSDWQSVDELEKQAEVQTEAQVQKSEVVLDVSSFSTVLAETTQHETKASEVPSNSCVSVVLPLPAGVRLPVRGAMLPVVGYPQKDAEPVMTWTNIMSATMAVSVGVVFLARASHSS